MTKKLLRTIWNSTSRCYTRALKEQYPEAFFNISEEELDYEDFDVEMRKMLDSDEPHRSPEIHEKYLKYIKQLLSDQELALVIEAHEKKKITRDGTTIHACMDELFERSVNSETRRKHGKSSNVPKRSLRVKRAVRSNKRRSSYSGKR